MHGENSTSVSPLPGSLLPIWQVRQTLMEHPHLAETEQLLVKVHH